MISPSLLLRWSKANNIAATGTGPFSSASLRAIRRNECMRCGQSIADSSLLGNSLVVKNSHVVVHCRECRGGGNFPRNCYQSYGRFYASSFIVELDLHTCADARKKMNWHEALICARTSFAFFQSTHHRPKEAFKRVRGRIHFGELFAIGSCGECGAFWHNETQPKIGNPDEPGASWSNFECWCCKVPHELQWHMRTTRIEERQLLFGGWHEC